MAGKPRAKTLTASVPEDLYNFIDDFHWKAKTKRSNLIRDILTSWAISKGYEPDGPQGK